MLIISSLYFSGRQQANTNDETPLVHETREDGFPGQACQLPRSPEGRVQRDRGGARQLRKVDPAQPLQAGGGQTHGHRAYRRIQRGKVQK